MKRFFPIIFIFLYPLLCFGAGLKEDLNTRVEKLIPNVESNKNTDYVSIAKEIQYWIFVVVGMIAVAYIIAIGTKLLWAQGSQEKLKDAIKGLAFIVLGLAIIPFAYFLVQLIVNLRVG